MEKKNSGYCRNAVCYAAFRRNCLCRYRREIQVAQPSQLEIQLGPQWAGVEFQMRTDAGLYPGVITVDETGVLRMEIGGSTTYTLSSMNSSVAVPDPEEPSQAPATIEPVSEEPEESAEIQETEEDAPDGEQGQDPAANVAGIPVQHLIFFGAGLVLAVGSLIALRFVKRRNASMEDDEYDDDDLPD